MNFQRQLAEKVLHGEKTVTRRLASDNPRSPWSIHGCALKVGRSYAVCPGRGRHAIGRVVVTDVRGQRLSHLTDEEARREGFPSAFEFEVAWQQINGSYDPDA